MNVVRVGRGQLAVNCYFLANRCEQSSVDIQPRRYLDGCLGSEAEMGKYLPKKLPLCEERMLKPILNAASADREVLFNQGRDFFNNSDVSFVPAFVFCQYQCTNFILSRQTIAWYSYSCLAPAI